MRVKIHREGTNIIIVLLFILLIFNGLAFLFISYKTVPIVFASISGILFLFVVNFFRSPRRHFKGEKKKAVLASVDGTVVALEEVYEPFLIKEGFIIRTPRGREATELAYRHLGLEKGNIDPDDPSLF